jgi:2-polyprenyl-3-methyl-5-hydroxy-6-metoxy-1,4-benzoquinol methylase
MKCKCCSFDGANEVYQVKEMQLGLGEIFNYQLCSSCGCMQLLDIPVDLSVYYPSDKYYSFNALRGKLKKNWVSRLQASYLVHGDNKLLGGLLSIGYRPPAFFEWMKMGNVSFTDPILDVGCGDGSVLVSMHKYGFNNLTGVDPFNATDLEYGPVKIHKKDIYELDGQYRFIMLNHVFEHMDEPVKTMQRLYDLLLPESYLVISTPVMGTYSWQHYKENWMGLDAPRHIIIHSVKSMHLLAVNAGFTVKKTEFNGTSYTLVASEQYLKGISLIDPNSYIFNKQSTLFTKAEIDAFDKIAAANNSRQQGDQAAYFLYKA